MWTMEDILRMRAQIEKAAALITNDEEAQAAAWMFPPYDPNGHEYAAGERFTHDGVVYAVLQAHTSLPEWTPDSAPSLYKPIAIAENGVDEWVQPVGSSDAYNTGDHVMYEGTEYVSLINGNVWSPVAYPQGWERV